MIYLEPREVYDKAIIGKEGNLLVYSFWAIVDALIDTGMNYIEAVEDIELNIKGTYMEGWPIIYNDEESLDS